MEASTISSTILTAFSGFEDQLWLVVPAGLGIALVIWGVPKAKNFVKRLGS